MKRKKTRFLRTESLLLFCLLLLTLFSGCGEKEMPEVIPQGRVTGLYRKETTSVPETLPVIVEKTPETHRVTFVGCGDNITYFGNTRDAKSLSDGTRTYNFRPIFSEVKDKIAEADIAFLNQENVMSTSHDISYYPRFNCPTDMGYDLWETGFDVLNIATNHMLDAYESGLIETIDFLESLGFTLIGGYKNGNEVDAIRVLEKNGVRIAFLAYTEMTNGLSLPAGSEVVIPYLKENLGSEELIRRQFAEAKEVADAVIVSAHWGAENNFAPNVLQKEYAQLFADLGALAVLGHHPHVLQPIEWLTGQNGNQTLCVYSLGNFAAEMDRDYHMCGGMISFTIAMTDGERPVLEDVLFTPTVFEFDSRFYNNRVRLLENYTDAEAKKHGISYYGQYTSLARLTGYFTDTISGEFLPDFLKTGA